MCNLASMQQAGTRIFFFFKYIGEKKQKKKKECVKSLTEMTSKFGPSFVLKNV